MGWFSAVIEGLPRRALLVGTIAVAVAIAMVTALLVGMQVAKANHSEASISGSSFEIDTDANLKVEDAAPPSLDWANVNEIRRADDPTGQNDRSFGQGTKEDTAVPSVVTGGIPPNKSDLKFFGVYQEGSTSSGFLNLFWSRVQDPSGTTNMDFEFNKRQCTPGQTPADSDCTANGLTPIRSVGDLLITYDLSNGGTVATISFRKWDGSKWGPTQSVPNEAVGTINTSTIPAAESDGLGAQDPRTFGEAQIKLSALLDPNKCESFGSAYLKSRSSDSFTAALKDFVPPQAVSISNCGRVVVAKDDEAGNPVAGATFSINPANSATPPVSTLSEVAPGVFCIDNLLIGTTYTVTETKAPPGYDLPSDPDQTFTPSQTGSCGNVTGSTPPDLTFVDPAQKGAIQVTKAAKHADSSTSPDLVATFSVKDQGGNEVGTVTTDASGIGCLADLALGTYTVTETSGPSGYALDSSTKTANVSGAGTCSEGFVDVDDFVNTPLTNLKVSVDSQVPGGTTSTIECKAPNGDTVASGSTPASGDVEVSASDQPYNNTTPYTCTILIDP